MFQMFLLRGEERGSVPRTISPGLFGRVGVVTYFLHADVFPAEDAPSLHRRKAASSCSVTDRRFHRGGAPRRLRGGRPEVLRAAADKPQDFWIMWSTHEEDGNTVGEG